VVASARPSPAGAAAVGTLGSWLANGGGATFAFTAAVAVLITMVSPARPLV